MTKKEQPKTLMHSFSSLSTFQQCPYKDYRLNVMRDIKDPGSEATDWGTRVHKALEDRVKDGTPLPEILTWLEGTCKVLTNAKGEIFTEQRLGVDRKLKNCEWRDRWIGGIVDLAIVFGEKAWVGDWKTGNPKYTKTQQLELMAALIMAKHLDVKEVTGSFLQLKEKFLDQPIKLHRGDLKLFWAGFLDDVQRREQALKENNWPKRGSILCRWCPVGIQGECEVYKLWK